MPATRVRSDNSDRNQMFLDQVKLSVLCDMGMLHPLNVEGMDEAGDWKEFLRNNQGILPGKE